MIRSLLIAVLLGSAALQSVAPSVSPNPGAGYRPVFRLGTILDNRDLEEAVRSGLPIRIRVRVELWRDQLIDNLTGSINWTAALAYDPLDREFRVRFPGTAERSYATYVDARRAFEGAYGLAIRPTRDGFYYYTASIEIETLALSDLKELERWLQGELQPAVSGDRSVTGALGEGAKRLLVRVLSMPNRKVDVRSERFEFRVPITAL